MRARNNGRVRLLKSGRWQAFITDPATGKRRHASAKTEAEAAAKLEELRQMIAVAAPPPTPLEDLQGSILDAAERLAMLAATTTSTARLVATDGERADRVALANLVLDSHAVCVSILSDLEAWAAAEEEQEQSVKFSQYASAT